MTTALSYIWPVITESVIFHAKKFHLILEQKCLTHILPTFFLYAITLLTGQRLLFNNSTPHKISMETIRTWRLRYSLHVVQSRSRIDSEVLSEILLFSNHSLSLFFYTRRRYYANHTILNTSASSNLVLRSLKSFWSTLGQPMETWRSFEVHLQLHKKMPADHLQ